jgi:hypothetical protein
MAQVLGSHYRGRQYGDQQQRKPQIFSVAAPFSCIRHMI